jgi:SAM-dependent methyltransferase
MTNESTGPVSCDSRHLAERDRIRDVYAKRDQSRRSLLYGWQNADVHVLQWFLRLKIRDLLLIAGLQEVQGIDILDVGCGRGGLLRMLLEWGADPSRIHGLDVLPDRIRDARQLSPNIDIRLTDGWPIPFPASTIDLACAFTVFSSILAPEGRIALATEILRILRPSGIALIYDFRMRSPTNSDTVAIKRADVLQLFRGCKVLSRTLTLAPPISRKLAPYSPLAAALLEAMCPFLRTHTIYLVRKS